MMAGAAVGILDHDMTLGNGATHGGAKQKPGSLAGWSIVSVLRCLPLDFHLREKETISSKILLFFVTHSQNNFQQIIHFTASPHHYPNQLPIFLAWNFIRIY